MLKLSEHQRVNHWRRAHLINFCLLFLFEFYLSLSVYIELLKCVRHIYVRSLALQEFLQKFHLLLPILLNQLHSPRVDKDSFQVVFLADDEYLPVS